ncbi:MAG: ferritin family protein [Armatimonadia bacterium]
MPDFADPFSGRQLDRAMTLGELTRALRLSIAAELEAIHLYESMADSTDNDLAAAVLRDIANEERVHVGEFQHVLNLLLEDEVGYLQAGAAEVDAMNAALSGEAPAAASEPAVEAAEPPAAPILTVGSLR